MNELPVRLRAYEDLAYGLFLHWGLYSQIESGEWVRKYREIPKEEYAALASSFTAKHFDARRLVQWAKQVGFRYICLTTRHHDGFSLYDTRGLNDFDAPHSAARRDLVAEFAAACHDEGLAMFFYHTTLDWLVESFRKDFPAYLEYLRNSVEILCTQYGKVAGLWFDGNWACPEADWEEDRLYGLIRKHQPDCVIINNSSVKARGARGHPEVDVLTFEQGVPTQVASPGRCLAREMCETINSHWGTASLDLSHKSPAGLITTLAACRGAGANLLLNIGPHADGSLPDYEKSALDLVGRWITHCGSSIYRGRPTSLVCRGQDFVLQEDMDYFCFVHHIPISGNLHLQSNEPGSGLKTIQGKLPRIARVCWTDNGESLGFCQDHEKQMFTFDATPFPYGRETIVRVARLEVAS